jgi:ferritin-like protein
MKDMVCSFGSRLRTHRLMVGRTLQEVADASGCTKACLSQEGKDVQATAAWLQTLPARARHWENYPD